uniref:Putative product n=1 Tax=Xenopsylla cheopis TaxID=163159 RepID=A0A6M2DCL4_XENCH
MSKRRFGFIGKILKRIDYVNDLEMTSILFFVTDCILQLFLFIYIYIFHFFSQLNLIFAILEHKIKIIYSLFYAFWLKIALVDISRGKGHLNVVGQKIIFFIF